MDEYKLWVKKCGRYFSFLSVRNVGGFSRFSCSHVRVKIKVVRSSSIIVIIITVIMNNRHSVLLRIIIQYYSVMTLMNVFLERYIMNITASMISYHYSVLVLTINYLRPKGHLFELPRCALELHENLFYHDVCLNRCSSAICYAWFCTSVCIFVLVFLSFIFRVFSSTTYMLKFFFYGY